MELTLEMAKKMMKKNGGNLNLSGMNVTDLPGNLTVEGYVDLSNTLITCLPNGLKVKGSLYLDNTGIHSLPDDLVVGGSLNLFHSRIRNLPDNLTVRRNLDLRNASIRQLPNGLKVKGNLYLSNSQIVSLPDDLIVGGNLYLGYTRIASLPNNLIVGGCLDLMSIPIRSLPNGLIIGRSLYLNYTGITNLPDDLVVGGYLDLENTQISSLPDSLKVGEEVCADSFFGDYQKLKNGDYEPGRYLYADGILTHVRRAKKVGDYTFYVGKIPGRNVVSDGTHYAHCETLREGIADLLFKTAKDRGADQYRSLTPDSEVKTGDAIVMYRIITGACLQGTRAFVQSLGELKDFYTVREIAELTKGQYGSEAFSRFFDI